MNSEKSHGQAYIDYLAALSERDTSHKRKAWSALKRGLPDPPTSVDMMLYIEPWTRKSPNQWWKDTHYMIASLYTIHPRLTDTGCMGNHLGDLYNLQPRGSLLNRIKTLQTISRPLFYTHLRSCIGLLAQSNIAINWPRLFYDVARWPNRARQWGAAFYAVTQ